ncbi:MAG: membrane protein of unknown function [Promethearchaeota archaeon]|jgi:uncharacterized membrane protein (DUF4010 family)|nr:MAG: membrane protein of unknown function [Candidatus Lokiarchaeota archaeon]
MTQVEFYNLFVKIIVSFFCGFVVGIERTRQSAQYGARDHIFYSIIATTLIILYENYLENIGMWILSITIGGMILFLLIGSVYRLFHEEDPGYTTTLSMILAMVVGILSYYNFVLSIAISVIFLIILSTKKQFYKIKELQRIEWTGTVQFIAIVVLLLILIPEDIVIVNINLRSVIIIFITILAIKYFSYFLLRYSAEHNLYYISLLGGFAHSEATTMQLAEIGASSASIWLVIQTMLGRMILILLLGAVELLQYAFLPILLTATVGLFGSFLILKNKKTKLKFRKIENPLSVKSALIFTGTYALALLVTFILDYFILQNFIAYSFISFLIGLLSGGASSLFVTTAFLSGLINSGQALILLAIGLTAAILNKIFYSLQVLDTKKNKKKYAIHLIFYQSITIFLLVSSTILTIYIFSLPFL